MMKKISFILMVLPLWFFSGMLSASVQGEYIYYVPHVVSYPEFYSAHHGYTNLIVTVTMDNTEFEIDQDGDGIYETQFSNLLPGSYEVFSRSNWPSPYGTLSTGASVRSDKPLQLSLQFGINHFTTYDAGYLYTSLLPVSMWGSAFLVPTHSSYLYIFAPSDTVTRITPPGHPPTDHTIPAGTNLKLSAPVPGTTITADNPVYVLAVNCQPDQNFPWMYNVLPLSRLGNHYIHDSTYGEVDISWPWPTDPKIHITAVDDNTPVTIDENKDGNPEFSYQLNSGESVAYTNPVQGAHIQSDKNIYVVGVENWAAPFIGKYGGAATEYMATSFYGTDYALFDVRQWREIPENNPRIFIAASEDNTHVDIDFGWDGIDLSNTIGSGDVWAVFWPEEIANTAKIKSSKGVQVIYRTDFSHPHHPGAMCAYTAIPLTVNSPPESQPTGAGTYEINTPVTLGGVVSDVDGDPVNYAWLKGSTVLFSGVIQSAAGGTPVNLPGHTLSTLPLGIHHMVLRIDDGVNDPVDNTITIEVVDTTPPVLNPTADKTTLWPPNHKMTDIVIEANASDNSGGPVTLGVSISSNEAINGLGDGDRSPDWTEPVIDQNNGIIRFQLRAERSGKGNGRVYTVTVTASDPSSNTTTQNIEISVPHDRKKK
ncbi:MAG: hypothetical protein GY940_07030 [bacterium]|nr:hypothetical protein [bacterium]